MALLARTGNAFCSRLPAARSFGIYKVSGASSFLPRGSILHNWPASYQRLSDLLKALTSVRSPSLKAQRKERTTYSIDVIFIHSGQAGRSIIRLFLQCLRESPPSETRDLAPNDVPAKSKWEEKPMDCGGFIRHSPLKEGVHPRNPYLFLNSKLGKAKSSGPKVMSSGAIIKAILLAPVLPAFSE